MHTAMIMSYRLRLLPIRRRPCQRWCLFIIGVFLMDVRLSSRAGNCTRDLVCMATISTSLTLICPSRDIDLTYTLRLVQLFLTLGHLVQYHIMPESALHRRESHRINLLDAHVASGYFAALALPKGQFNPCDPIVPRRYQDGLEADDPDEDMLFMIWYRRHAPVVNKL